MNLHTLPKITQRKAKIVGRGIGSGKGGHTTGRGNKGQKARERVTIWFEGTKNKKALIQRLPMLRGKGKFKPWGRKYTALDVKRLAEWPEKTVVNDENLIKAGILNSREKAKLVGRGPIKPGLKVEIPMTLKLGQSKTEEIETSEKVSAKAGKSKQAK